MTIRQIEKTFIAELTPLYGFDEARNLAWLTISYTCKLNRIEYLGAKEHELPLKDETSLSSYLEQLKVGKPLQYILGETEFYGLPFKVNSSVLIPRPETEELVDWIIKEVGKGRGEFNSESFNILDIGTGSGCIPVALKKHLSDARVFAVDISSEAIETAFNNSKLNETEVFFWQDDILNPAHAELLKTTYKIIVSNPPYVTMAEKDRMHKNVLEYEPHGALFVNDSDPLQFYRAIALFAKSHLDTEGQLFLEINENLGKETVSLLKDNGFINIELRSDLRGKSRMIKANVSR